MFARCRQGLAGERKLLQCVWRVGSRSQQPGARPLSSAWALEAQDMEWLELASMRASWSHTAFLTNPSRHNLQRAQRRVPVFAKGDE